MSAQIDARIYELIAKRDKAVTDRNSLLPYQGYDDFKERRYQQELAKREQAVKAADMELLAFIKATYHNYLVEGDMAATIAKIMENIQIPQAASAGFEEDINPFR